MKTLDPTLVIRNIWQVFPYYEIKLLNKYDHWRKLAKILKLSKDACLRLDGLFTVLKDIMSLKFPGITEYPGRLFTSGLRISSGITYTASINWRINPKLSYM